MLSIRTLLLSKKIILTNITAKKIPSLFTRMKRNSTDLQFTAWTELNNIKKGILRFFCRRFKSFFLGISFIPFLSFSGQTKTKSRAFGLCLVSRKYTFAMGVIQIRLLGIKQLSLSIGIGSSHIHMMPPFPRFKEALSITLYFLTSRRSGEALFLISNG